MKFFRLLLFFDSRKVAFGLWVFIIATYFLTKGLINADNWILCMFVSSGLLGGGTITDRYLDIKKEKKQ